VAVALIILCGGIVLVAFTLALKCPSDKVPELARALARWLGAYYDGRPRPPCG